MYIFKKILLTMIALNVSYCYGRDFDSDASRESSPIAAFMLRPGYAQETTENADKSPKKRIYEIIIEAEKAEPFIDSHGFTKQVDAFTQEECTLFLRKYNSYSTLESIGSFEGSKKNIANRVERAFEDVIKIK